MFLVSYQINKAGKHYLYLFVGILSAGFKLINITEYA
jgi:hypothetical protein